MIMTLVFLIGFAPEIIFAAAAVRAHRAGTNHSPAGRTSNS